jgi:Abnormal spindle-like microcephaly-assoc'd, ASPM-SPD-2-Hydin
MKNIPMSEWFSGAENLSTNASSAVKKPIPAATLGLLLFAILSSSGCIGLTGVSKVASGQQSTTGAATISVEPASVSFGSVALGGSASQSVTITNGGGSNLTVTQASTKAAGVTITGISLPLTIEAGKQSTFNIIFAPKAPGALSGKVSVLSDISSSQARYP